MKETNILNHYKRIFSVLFLILIIAGTSLTNTMILYPESVNTGITLILFVLYFIISVLNIYKLKEFIFHISILLVAALSYLMTGASIFTLMLMSINALRYLKIKEILTVYVIVRIIFVATIISLALLGVISNDYFVVVKSGVRYVGKYALGFTHPNQLAQALGSLLLAIYSLIYRYRLNWLSIVSYFLLALGVYYLTASRIFLLISIVFVLFNLLFKIKIAGREEVVGVKFVKNNTLYIAAALFVGILLPYFMTISIGGFQSILYKINGLFSSRLSFGGAVMEQYPLNLFGTTFSFDKLENLYGNFAVDNSYINLIYGFGIIPFLLLVLFFKLSLDKLFIKNYYILILVFYLFLFWGSFENILTNVSIDFAFLLVGSILLNEDNRVEEGM